MDISRCDSCGKPLGEGAVGRGDAIRRGELLLCSTCISLEANGRVLPFAPPEGSEEKWRRIGDPEDGAGLTTERQKPREQSAVSHGSDQNTDEEEVQVEIDGVEYTAGRIERDASGRVVIVLEGYQGDRDSDRSETAPTSKTSSSSTQRLPTKSSRKSSNAAKLPPRKLSAIAAASAPERRSTIGLEEAKRRSRSRGLPAAAIVLLVISVAAMSAALFMAFTTQARYDALVSVWNAEMQEQSDQSDGNRVKMDSIDARLREFEDALKRANEKSSRTGDSARSEGSAAPLQEQPVMTSISEAGRRALLDHEARLARAVVEHLRSSDRGIRIYGLTKVIEDRMSAAAADVRRILREGDAAERQLAADALGALRDVESLGVLLVVSRNDEAEEVKLAARRALSQLDGEPRDMVLSGYSLSELKAFKSMLEGRGELAAARDEIDREIAERELGGQGDSAGER